MKNLFSFKLAFSLLSGFILLLLLYTLTKMHRFLIILYFCQLFTWFFLWRVYRILIRTLNCRRSMSMSKLVRMRVPWHPSTSLWHPHNFSQRITFLLYDYKDLIYRGQSISGEFRTSIIYRIHIFSTRI